MLGRNLAYSFGNWFVFLEYSGFSSNSLGLTDMIIIFFWNYFSVIILMQWYIIDTVQVDEMGKNRNHLEE